MPELWAAGVAGSLLLGMGLLRFARGPVRAGRVLTGLAALALGATLGLAVWAGGWSARDLHLALLATLTAALGVFTVLEPATGGRFTGALLAGSVLAALALAELALVSGAAALGPAERLWPYPASWAASSVGYGAFGVAGLAALSERAPGRRGEEAGGLAHRATVVGLLALGMGVVLGTAWNWSVWGSVWRGQDSMLWNTALAACGAAAVHAWRRESVHRNVRAGLAVAGLVLVVVALLAGA